MNADVVASPDQSSDGLQHAGETVLNLIREAAENAARQAQQAFDVAHKLSFQLKNAEARIEQLELELRHAHDRAGRAESWLERIGQEIQQQFLNSNQPPDAEPAPRNGQRPPTFRRQQR